MQSPKESLLRDEYYRLFKQDFPQRAKGKPYRNLVVFWLIAMLLSGVLLVDIQNQYNLSNAEISWVAIIPAFVIVFTLDFFLTRKARTLRKNGLKYPLVTRTRNRFKDSFSREHRDADMPVLWIDGQKYFLVRYYKLVKVRRNAYGDDERVRGLPVKEYTSMILLDEEGRIIKSNELFARAFLTLKHADTGADEAENRERFEPFTLEQLIRHYFPRAMTFLHWQKGVFEKYGDMAVYARLETKMHELLHAMIETYSIMDVKERVKKSMGYSFGLEFFYEDAVLHEKINRAYSLYIMAEYQGLITEICEIIDPLEEYIKVHYWPFRWITRWIIKTIREAMDAMLTMVSIYRWEGIPTEQDWAAYLKKFEFARRNGAPIVEVGRFREEYVWEGALYHDSFLEEQAGERGLIC